MSTDHPGPPDPAAELLTQALREEADTIDTDPVALQSIRQRVSATKSRRPWVYAGIGAAAATAAVIAGISVVANHSDQGSKGPEPAVTPSPTTVTQVQPVQRAVQVYYVGSSTHRLYVETREVTLHGSAAASAVEAFLSSLPADPDYVNGWPSGVHAVDVASTDAETTITLKGPSDVRFEADPALGPDGGRLALDALLRTAGVPPGAKASFVYNETKLDSLFGVDLPVTVESDDQSRALISIDNIVDGQTVSNPVSVEVSGNTFEGTVNWQLLDDGGAKLDQGFVTTSMGQWAQATIDLGTLDPGTYTIRCLEYSPENGKPGNIDDKTFTVD
ncbi:MAG TPA: Gmad2 immunoglobulin-like domain-containing protein [Nocardioidaceae bacterium]